MKNSVEIFRYGKHKINRMNGKRERERKKNIHTKNTKREYLTHD